MGRRRAFALHLALAIAVVASAPAQELGISDLLQHPVIPTLPPGQSEQLSACSAEFGQAVVAGFLSESHLSQKELACVVNGSGSIGGSVGGLAGQLAPILGISIPDLRKFCNTASPISKFRAALGAHPVGGINGSMVSRMFSRLGGGHSASVESGAPKAAASAAAAPAAAAPRRWAPKAAGNPQGSASDGSSSGPSLKLFFNDGRRLQRSLPGFRSLPGIPTQAPTMGPEASSAGVAAVPFAMQMGVSLHSIVTEWSELVGVCVQSDTKAQFELAANHLTDLQYLTGLFLANGAQIVAKLADSVVASGHQNVKQFGYASGKTLRKVLLSNSTSGQPLGGTLGSKELANVTSGFMQGIWGPGTYLEIGLEKHPRNPVRVNMNSCVRDNSAFFQQVLATTMFAFGQATRSSESMLQFGTLAATTALQVPSTLSNCNIDPEQQEALKDAILATSGASPRIRLPRKPVSKQQLTKDFSQMLMDWSQQHWFDFGHGLGKFLQVAAIKYYPGKYSVDAAGTLRRQLLQPSRDSAFFFFLAPAAVLLATGLLAVKHRRLIGSWRWGAAVAADDLEAVRSIRVQRCPEGAVE